MIVTLSQSAAPIFKGETLCVLHKVAATQLHIANLALTLALRSSYEAGT